MSGKKTTYITIAASLLVSGIVFLVFIKTDPLPVFSPDQETSYTVYNDSVDGGHSVIEKTTCSSSGLHLEYTLHKGFTSPYVGLIFREFYPVADVSVYNRLHVEIEAAGPDNVFVYLFTKDSHVKDTTHRLASRHSAANLLFREQQRYYDIPLEDFVTPVWWYEVIGQSAVNFGPVELDKLRGVSLATGAAPELDKKQSLTIQKVYFYTDYSSFFLIVILMISGIVLMLYFYEILRLRNSANALEVVYKPTSIPEPKDDKKAFLTYIHQNYTDAELSLGKVARECGVSERLISKNISDQYQCNFKTYINRIRVEEAKRLLRNSNLNISEIAYHVGFNSPSTFTKVFKKIAGQAPSFFISKTNA